jgi:FkbM family methyltransferase
VSDIGGTIKRWVRSAVGPEAYSHLGEWKARTQHGLRLLSRADPWIRPTLGRCGVEQHGEWYVCPDDLGPDTVVYSMGVGRDVSFDLSVIGSFGAEVFAFDPTPEAVRWVRSQSLPTRLHVVELGVAGFDGAASFHAPSDPKNPSFGFEGPSRGRGGTVTCEVRRLSTLMAMLGHREIGLLKLDVEGAEYEVIADLLSQRVPVNQLLVEFHHRKPGIGPKKTHEAVRSLRAHGFELFHVSPSGQEFAFRRL